MTHNTPNRLLLAALLLGAAVAARAADFVIIVNKDNANPVSEEFAAKAYRGEAKSWPSGGDVNAYALPEDNAARIAFDKGALNKTPSQSKTLWAQLTFSGKAVPPKIVESEDAVIKAVAENKNGIGYVSAGANVSSVKAVK